MAGSITKYRLTDIAIIERAKKGRIYPAGTCYIQVSATKGQIGILEEDGTVESKYAVILPQIEVAPLYFKMALERNAPYFCARYQANINIQVSDFSFFEIELHDDYEFQVQIAEILAQVLRVVRAIKRNLEVWDRFNQALFVLFFPEVKEMAEANRKK